jgi:putative sigma-54 modulation protein
MKVEIKGVHVDVTERVRKYLDAKMPRLDFARELIVDLLLNLGREKSLYRVDATLNFRWGTSRHVGAESFDLYQGIDALFDKLEPVVEKEKSRVKEHHRGEPAREG